MERRVLDLVLLHNPKAPAALLPNVQHLTVNLTDFELPKAFLKLVVGPALQFVDIHFQGDIDGDRILPHSIWNNMASILSSSSDLRFFVMGGEWQSISHHHFMQADFGMQPELLQLSRGFPHLEEFHAQSAQFDSETLSHFAALPNLKRFSVAVDSEVLDEFVPGSLDIFDSLVELDIKTSDLDAAQRLFSCPGFGNVESICICGLSTGWFGDPYHFFGTLCNRPSKLPLKSLILRHGGVNEGSVLSPSSSELGTHTLMPLLSFSDMTILKLYLNVAMAVDDHTLGMMADAWPRLRVLTFSEPIKLLPPKITFNGLRCLAACDDLELLTIRMDLTGPIPDITQLGNFSPG